MSFCGDCDLDSQGPDVIDALQAAQISIGVVTPNAYQVPCCDVDSSGVIDITDALMIAQVSVGLPIMLTCM